jgi:hypothetical protein
VKKLENLAKNINKSILENASVVEYLRLKKDIENDEALQSLKAKLDMLRKEI